MSGEAIDLAALRLRADINTAIRAFFAERGVLEVETPVLSAAGNTEPNIEGFQARFTGHVDAGSPLRWLRTSPEYPLKRLLAAGVGDCYELGRVFRNGEAGGRHNPEFTMLEWYRVGWDDRRLAGETIELVQQALVRCGRQADVRLTPYRDLFLDGLGIDPFTASLEQLQAPLASIRIDGEGLGRRCAQLRQLSHSGANRRSDEHQFAGSNAGRARRRSHEISGYLLQAGHRQ